MFWYNNPKWTNISLFILKAFLQKKDGFLWGTVNVTKTEQFGYIHTVSPSVFFYPPGFTSRSFPFSHWFKQIWYFLNFIKYVHWFLHTSLLCLFCCTIKKTGEKKNQTDKLTNKQKALAFSVEPPKRWKSLAWRTWPGIIYLDLWEDLRTTHSCHFVRIVVILQSFASFPGPRPRGDRLTVKCEKKPLYNTV